MEIIVCTLFERHYHYGLVGLVNTLSKKGFTGNIYAGYKGRLPRWTDVAVENEDLNWAGGRTMQVNQNLNLHLLPVITDSHLTNYKPDFMLALMNGVGKASDGIVYLDPDIVITAPWEMFPPWLENGIALCEDASSPIGENHPRRAAWRKYFKEKGCCLKFKDPMYVNGGFVGVTKENIEFINLWQHLQELMAEAIGGLQHSVFSGNTLPIQQKGDFAPFARTDQDVLNAAVEATDLTVSIIGWEGMGFKSCEPLLPHAVGYLKPWRTNYLSNMIKGIAPRRVDREFWQNQKFPLRAFKLFFLRYQLFAIGLSAFVGRFYGRR